MHLSFFYDLARSGLDAADNSTQSPFRLKVLFFFVILMVLVAQVFIFEMNLIVLLIQKGLK